MNQATLEQNQRIFFALVALGIGLIVYQTFFFEPPPPPSQEAPAAALAEEPQVDPAGPPAAAHAASGDTLNNDPTAPTPEVVPPQLMLVRADGSMTSWWVSNEGAVPVTITLDEPERYQPREDMQGVFPEKGRRLPPFALTIDDLSLREGSVYTFDEGASIREGEAFSRLVYRWVSPDGQVTVTRTYAPDTRPFGVVATVEIENRGPQALEVPAGLTLRVYGEYTGASGGMLNPSASILEAICRAGRSVQRRHGRKVEERMTYPGPVWFAGVTERYFLTAVAPRGPDGGAAATGDCAFQPAGAGQVAADLRWPAFRVEAGSRAVVADMTLYAGPKHSTYLTRYTHEFEDAIDLGWMAFLSLPIRWLLLFLQGWFINWGLAIIFLTVVIKLLLWPLTTKSFRSMEKMREISPQLQELRKKYENDPTKMAEAQLKLFRETGVSPLGGCLPMLLQMPIYLALYQTIWGSAELYQAPFALWVTDLSQRDPLFLLPILMGGIMYVQQKMMPQTVDNPQMKIIQTVMPVMFTGFMLFLPSGLVLYILANMLLSIGQQLMIRRTLAKEKEALAGRGAPRKAT